MFLNLLKNKNKKVLSSARGHGAINDFNSGVSIVAIKVDPNGNDVKKTAAATEEITTAMTT